MPAEHPRFSAPLRLLARVEPDARPQHRPREAARRGRAGHQDVAAATGEGVEQAQPSFAGGPPVSLKGRGRVRVGDGDPLTLEALDALLLRADVVRQIFNDTDSDALWLVVGAPPEAANTPEMTPEQLAHLYPDGPKALPPELS